MVQNQSTRRRGFTLIEIMAVVLIIGLLSGIVGLAVFQQVDKGRVTATMVQIKNLEGVLEIYRMDRGRFPTTERGLAALVTPPSSPSESQNYPPGGYLKGGRVPKDAWGQDYLYEAPGQHNRHFYDLWSLGADGAEGGTGVDGDIGNWTESGDDVGS